LPGEEPQSQLKQEQSQAPSPKAPAKDLPPSKYEDKASTPYSDWYFKNRASKKELEDAPIEKKLKVNNTSDYDATLDRMAPSDL
jgi:hypothetical protein